MSLWHLKSGQSKLFGRVGVSADLIALIPQFTLLKSSCPFAWHRVCCTSVYFRKTTGEACLKSNTPINAAPVFALFVTWRRRCGWLIQTSLWGYIMFTRQTEQCSIVHLQSRALHRRLNSDPPGKVSWDQTGIGKYPWFMLLFGLDGRAIMASADCLTYIILEGTSDDNRVFKLFLFAARVHKKAKWQHTRIYIISII